MSTATVEEFQNNPAAFLAAVEHGDSVIIARGRKPVACLSPMRESESTENEYEAWGQYGLRNLARAFGPEEPDYPTEAIVEPNPSYRPS